MRNIIKQVLNEEIDSKSERVKSMVNKYGIKKAIELVVGNKHTIRKAYQDNPSSYLDQFNNLTPVKKDAKLIYMDKYGEPIFYYYPNGESVTIYINYYLLWVFFDEIMFINFSKIREIIYNWLENNYNLKGFTTMKPFIDL